MAKLNSKSKSKATEAPQKPARCEFYDRARKNYIPLQGEWISQAGFIPNMPIRIRVMTDCIVITAQNTRELWGCAEGLSVVDYNEAKVQYWLQSFPGALNDTGDLPTIKREMIG